MKVKSGEQVEDMLEDFEVCEYDGYELPPLVERTPENIRLRKEAYEKAKEHAKQCIEEAKREAKRNPKGIQKQ